VGPLLAPRRTCVQSPRGRQFHERLGSVATLVTSRPRATALMQVDTGFRLKRESANWNEIRRDDDRRTMLGRCTRLRRYLPKDGPTRAMPSILLANAMMHGLSSDACGDCPDVHADRFLHVRTNAASNIT
jgi:hypothetical protein